MPLYFGVVMSSFDQISPGGDQPSPAIYPSAPSIGPSAVAAVEASLEPSREPRRRSIWRTLMWLTIYGAIVALASAVVTWNVVHAEAAGPRTVTKQDVEAEALARLDLKPLLVDADQLQIFYPEEWQVIERQHGARLVIQEPIVAAENQTIGAIMYPKNITIARIRGAVPIDLAQKLLLEEDLRQGFGTRSRVEDYVVQTEAGGIVDLPHTKAIKMPATFTLGGIPMSQLNLLVSGKTNSYLISYVDAAANYTKDFRRVWLGLAQVKTTGGAPDRYRVLFWLLAGIGLALGLMALATWWQSKRVVYDYENDMRHLTDNDPARPNDSYVQPLLP